MHIMPGVKQTAQQDTPSVNGADYFPGKGFLRYPSYADPDFAIRDHSH